jgi:hypothetical protein
MRSYKPAGVSDRRKSNIHRLSMDEAWCEANWNWLFLENPSIDLASVVVSPLWLEDSRFPVSSLLIPGIFQQRFLEKRVDLGESEPDVWTPFPCYSLPPLLQVLDIKKKLKQSKRFWSNLPDEICIKDKLTESDEEQCWNSHAKARWEVFRSRTCRTTLTSPTTSLMRSEQCWNSHAKARW